MSETTHTPTPWAHYDDTDAAGKTGRHEIVATGKTVARIYGTRGREEEDRANAALIVRAVNCHEVLTEALRAMVDALDAGAANTDYGDYVAQVKAAEKLARAALAKAAS